MHAIAATAPFDGLAERYDEVFTNSLIGRAQRDVVWREMEKAFFPGSRVIEINCGTGEDALFLAEKGVEVVALDQSPAMIEVATQRRDAHTNTASPVSFAVQDTEALRTLAPAKKFLGGLSNFGGLNCVQDLGRVAHDLAGLLEPGSPLLLCMMGPACLWEVCWYLLQGQPRKAFRRFRRSPAPATIAGGPALNVWYHTTADLERMFQPFFRLKFWKGVGIFVPPSYLEPWAKRFPWMLRALSRLDTWLCRCPGIRGMADHILLVLERT